MLIVNFFECLIFICHGQLDFDDRETVFRCPVLLLHGCQPIDLNACFSLICISYVELCQRKQINLLLLLLLDANLDQFMENMGAYSEELGERFLQDRLY